MADLQVDSDDYAEQIIRLLWPNQPDPAVHQRARGGLLALPTARRPRLLVPADQRRAAASAVRRYNLRPGAGARLSTAALSAGLRSGILQRVIRSRSWLPTGDAEAGSITAQLRAVVSPDCVVAVYVGIPRANRKPVLLVLAPKGRLLAVAKLGVSALSRRLISNEAAALNMLAATELAAVKVPEVLFAGEWGGCELLVQSALPEPHRMPRDADQQRDRAAVAISAVGGVHRQLLGSGPVVGRLHERISELPGGPERDLAALRLDQLRAAYPELLLSVGSWHGDWTPWNIAPTRTHGLMVWDWERFTGGVPVGYDALHYCSQVAARLPAGPAAALQSTRAAVGELLDPFGIAPDARVPVFALYLLEMLVRYTEDDQAQLAAGRRWVDALSGTLTSLLPEISTADLAAYPQDQHPQEQHRQEQRN